MTSYRDIAHALDVLHGLPGLTGGYVGQQVKCASGEQGVCVYVERNTTDIPPYCLVKPNDGGKHQLWWLRDTQTV